MQRKHIGRGIIPQNGGPSRGIHCARLESADILAAAKGLTAAGVKFERDPGMEHDDLGIWTSPGGDRVAWFKGPDGNTLSISQHV